MSILAAGREENGKASVWPQVDCTGSRRAREGR